jgi:hypothetical protein
MSSLNFINQINTVYEPQDISYISLEMSCGYKKVAILSITDKRLKDKIHRISKNKNDHTTLMEIEKINKNKKVKAIAQGTWRSRLSHVSRFDDPEPILVCKHIPKMTYKTIGRFVVGTYA